MGEIGSNKKIDDGIVIDAGHSNTTAGKRTKPFTKDIDVKGDGTLVVKKGERYKEHTANAFVCDFFNRMCENRGIETFKTGWDDLDVTDDNTNGTELNDLLNRQNIIREKDMDLLVSFHHNADASTGNTFTAANGFSIELRHKEENKKDGHAFAGCCIKHMNEILGKKWGRKNRGIVENGSNLGMNNALYMKVDAAILFEFAFMTNEDDAQNCMANIKFNFDCALAVYMGVCDYVGIDYKLEKACVGINEAQYLFKSTDDKDDKDDKDNVVNDDVKKEKYVCQIAACNIEANARNFSKLATSSGIRNYTIVEGKMYKVLSGKYDTLTEANKQAALIKSKGYGVWVRKAVV